MEILFVALVRKIASSFLLAMTIIDATICQKDCNKGRDCCFKRTTGIAFQIKNVCLSGNLKKSQKFIKKIL